MPERFQSKRYQSIDAERQKLVGRNTRWGNPFPVEGTIKLEKPPRIVAKYAAQWGVSPEELVCPNDEQAVRRYREALEGGELDYSADDVQRELRGYDLGCPCGSEHCHANVLIDVANR